MYALYICSVLVASPETNFLIMNLIQNKYSFFIDFLDKNYKEITNWDLEWHNLLKPIL